MKTQLHDELMNDPAIHEGRVGKEFADMRGNHLKSLTALESMARELTPLPISYDVTRVQPPFFNEFTYTEVMGCFMISPQSAEISARVIRDSLSKTIPYSSIGEDKDIVDRIMMPHKDNTRSLDKYKLSTQTDKHDKIIFLPGSNVFKIMVSKECLIGLMHNDPEIVIKPHPMTNFEMLRLLGREFGYHRILEPKASGWEYLKSAQEVYVTTSTEIGLYATLLNKKIHNIGTYLNDARGAYNGLYYDLWNKRSFESNMLLHTILKSPYSGVFHPDAPEELNRARMDVFFKRCMEIRENFKPLVHDISPAEYSDFILNKINPPTKG